MDKSFTFKTGETAIIIGVYYWCGDGDLDYFTTDILFFHNNGKFKLIENIPYGSSDQYSYNHQDNRIECRFEMDDGTNGAWFLSHEGSMIKDIESVKQITNEHVSKAYRTYKALCSMTHSKEVAQKTFRWDIEIKSCSELDNFKEYLNKEWTPKHMFQELESLGFNLNDFEVICKKTCATDVFLSPENFKFALSNTKNTRSTEDQKVSPSKILGLTDSEAKPVVAILDFSHTSLDSKDDAGRSIAMALTTQAVNSRLFTIVERYKVDQLISEGHFGKNELSKIPAERIGEMLASNYIISGDYTVYKGSIKIYARLINVSDGSILLAEEKIVEDSLEGISESAKYLYSKMFDIIMPKSY